MMLFRQVYASARWVHEVSVLLLQHAQLHLVYYNCQHSSTLVMLTEESKVYQTWWLQCTLLSCFCTTGAFIISLCCHNSTVSIQYWNSTLVTTDGDNDASLLFYQQSQSSCREAQCISTLGLSWSNAKMHCLFSLFLSKSYSRWYIRLGWMRSCIFWHVRHPCRFPART